MNNKMFSEFLSDKLTAIDKLLTSKGQEYDSDSDDRLHSFKTAGAFTGMTSKQVLGGYLLKHVTSVYDMIREDSNNVDKWNEKINDIISYMILLSAIIEEENENEKH